MFFLSIKIFKRLPKKKKKKRDLEGKSVNDGINTAS